MPSGYGYTIVIVKEAAKKGDNPFLVQIKNLPNDVVKALALLGAAVVDKWTNGQMDFRTLSKF